MDPREEALWKKYAAKGVTPETHTLDMANGRFVPRTDVTNDGNAPQAESALGSFARAAAGGVGPAIGAGLGGAAGTVAGTAVAPLTGPAAPAMPLVVGLAGGIGGGHAGGALQHWAAEKIAPEITKEWNAQEELNRAEHPYASMAGTLLPMLLSNQASAFKNLKALGTVARSPISRNPAAMRTLRGAAVNAGIGAGLESVQEAMPGADVDPGKIALAAAGGAMMGDFRKPFKKVGGLAGPKWAAEAAFGHPGDDVTTVEAARGANTGKNWNEAVQAAAKAAGVKEAVPAADAPVPEAPDTIATQLTALADPSTTRKAVLVTPGTKSPSTPKGMRSVQTKHGRVIYNPEKATLQEIAAADAAEQFPGDLLGMSQEVKPAGGDMTVEAVTPEGTEASSEVVDGADPAAVKAAVDAAVAANGDGVTVKVTDPAEVIQKRLIAKRDRERTWRESELTAEQAQARAEQVQLERNAANNRAQFEGELGIPSERVKQAQQELTARKQRELQRVRDIDYKLAENERTLQEQEAARQELVKKFGAGQRNRLAQPEVRQGEAARYTPLDKTQPPISEDLTAPLTEAEQIQDDFDTGRRYQEKNGPPIIHEQPAVKQGWHDFWKRTALGRYLASGVNPGKVTMPNGKPARGVTDLESRGITIDPAIATLDTHPHEVFHLLLNDIAAHGTAGEKAYIKRAMEAFGGEEALTQAVGEHFVKRLDPKNDGMVRDVLDFVRYKLGRSNDRALLARLGSNVLGRGRGGADMPGIREAVAVPVNGESKRFQGSEDAMDDGAHEEPGLKSRTRVFTAPVEVLRGAKDARYKDVGNAILTAHHNAQELTAEFVNPVHDVVKGLDGEQKAAVRGALIDAFNEREPRYTGNAKLDRAIDTIRTTYAEIRERANEAGMKVTDRHGIERSGRIDPFGMPHILDKDVQHVLKNEVGSDQWNALVEEFKAYNRERLSAAHKKLSPADIEDILDAKVKYMSGGVQDLPAGIRSKQADRAMRLAQLTKLPESFIEKDIDKLWTTYARSAAHDLAQWINLERDPRIRALLGFNRHSADDLNIPPIAGHQVVKAAMEGFNKPFGTDDKISKLADTLSSATSAAIVANPKTRLLDLASVPFRSLTYTSPWHAPEIVVRSFTNAGDAWRASKATGFNKPGSQHVDNVIGAVNNTTKWVKKALQWYSKGTASEGIEAVSRAATQAMGRATIDTLAAPYARGNKEALRIINGLGTDAGELMATSAGRDKLASRLGGYTQGFYDARNEPQWLTGGTGKAIFRLSRWSVEQMNNFRKFQIEPLLKDGNPGPAISYLLAMAAGGAILNEAKDKLAGHKSYTATMKELQAAGDTPAARLALAQKLSGMAQIMGAFGYANDLAYMALSGMTGQPMNEWNVPLAKLASDGLRHTTAAAGAIARGAPVGDVLSALISNVAKQNVGMVRFIANQAESDEDRTTRNNKRNYAVYRTLHGQPAKPFAPIVGYDKLDEKEFDKEWDAGKAVNRLQDILAQTPPDRMVEKLRSLRATAPIGEGPRTKDTDKLVPYINWVRETQGDDAANELYRRLVEKETINEFKRGLVPSVR